uniref:Ribosomal protein S12 n=1 Tax=Populus trichocarpa TaxID=3694 RepID=A0A3N7G0B7_POPTR
MHTIHMPTIKQLIRTQDSQSEMSPNPRSRGMPQRRGTCTRVYVRLVQIQIVGWTKERIFHYP